VWLAPDTMTSASRLVDLAAWRDGPPTTWPHHAVDRLSVDRNSVELGLAREP